MAAPSENPPPPAGWFPERDIEDAAFAAFAELLELPAGEREVALQRLADPRVRAAVTALLRDHAMPAPIVTAMIERAEATQAPFAGPGTRIGPFRILEVLGRGGMGIVYRAEQERPQRQVALKLLTPGTADAEMLRRFEREVDLLGRLQHPGLCRILGAGYVDVGLGLGETAWYAMELVDGLPLTTFARQRQLPVAARCALLVQIADAVQHAHARGIVHRDLKPANVLVADGPEGPLIKVLDFGIAHVMVSDTTPSAVHTRTGMLLGTLGYMSPEQLAGGKGGIDARSDVWALGVIAYELLVDRLPLQLEALPLAAACKLVAERDPTPLGVLDAQLRGDLTAIVAKAMAKEAGERYESAAAFGADLQRFLRGEVVLARPASAWTQLRRFARRNRMLVFGVAATMIALLIGLVGMTILAAHNRELSRQEHDARGIAEATTERLRESLYRSQMRLGTEAMLAPGGIARVREIVAPWLPQPELADLRGFEWHLLWASCHRELAVAPVDRAPNALVWTTNGRLAANHVGSAQLLDAGDHAELSRCVDPTMSVFVSTTSADGRRFFRVVAGGAVAAIDVDSGRELGRFAHGAPVTALACCGRGHLVAAHGEDAQISIIDVDRAECVARIDGPVSGAMGFNRDGSHFACGWFPGTRGLASVWRVGDWTHARDLSGNDGEGPFQLALTDDAGTLATVDVRGVLRVFDVSSGVQTSEMRHDDGLRAVAFRPDGKAIAVGCRNYAVYVHDLTNGQRRELRGHAGIVGAVAWRPDGRRLASMGDDAQLRIWDPAQLPVRQETSITLAHAAEHGQLLWSDDSEALDIHVPDSGARRWVLTAGTMTETPLRFGEQPIATPAPFRFAARAPGGGSVAAGAARDGQLWLWHGGQWRDCAPAFVGDLRGLAWLGGERFAVIDSTDHIRIRDGGTGAELAVRAVPECTLSLAGSRDGSLLAIGCVDQAVRIWAPGANDMAALRGHTGHVEAVAFAPDGKRLASGGRDRTVRLWDLASAAEVGLLPTTDRVIALAWSPDGTRLAALQSGGGVVVWDARSVPQ